MTRTAYRLAFAIGSMAAAVAVAAPGGSGKGVPVAIPAGAPVNCVQIAQIRETRVRDDRTIDFVLTGKRVLRNRLPNACPELGDERAFSYATSLSQLCSVDIITVLRQGTPVFRGASCGLGPFQPVTLAR